MSKRILVVTDLENGDNLKVNRLVDAYAMAHRVIENTSTGNGIIEIKFVIKNRLFKKFKHDLEVLNFVGITAWIED